MNMLSQKKKQKKQKSGTFEQHYIIGAYEKMMYGSLVFIAFGLKFFQTSECSSQKRVQVRSLKKAS
jgi:hypothetical protein